MTPTIGQSVLVYDRIRQNRLTTILLVAIVVLAVIPFVGLLSYVGAEMAMIPFAPQSAKAPYFGAQLDQVRKGLEQPGTMQTEYYASIERHMQAELERVREQTEANRKLKWMFNVIFAVAGFAFLGLLFWSIAASPTTRVLAMCGARPADGAAAEAKRLLENLSIGAGLPVPKLFVIDSPVPNAFAAGTDPEHSVVAVTQGLLVLLDHRELEGVLAHEISHIGNRDARLNTVVTSIALFLRLPYLMWQRQRSEERQAEQWTPVRWEHHRIPYTIAMLPMIIYVFCIAPLLAAIIRAAISRSREYQADADAALLTRYPEGLMRALAKIRGAGSSIAGNNALISHLYFSDPSTPGAFASLFRGNFLATHPPIENRIHRLREFNSGVPVSVLEAALREGKEFAEHHTTRTIPETSDSVRNELAVLTAGNPMGRVYRVLSDTVLYERANLQSLRAGSVEAGALVVIFDDPGPFRQVLTHNHIFGYMPAKIKVQRVDLLPTEIQDPAARAAVQNSLGPLKAPPQPAAGARASSPEATAQVAATAVAQAGTGPDKLSGSQLAIAAACFVLVFLGIFLALLKFGK